MDKMVLNGGLGQKMLQLFAEHRQQVGMLDSPRIHSLREDAIQRFEALGFPDQANEKWKSTSLAKPLMLEYMHFLEPFEEAVDLEKIFRCEVPDLDSYVVTQYNGWYHSRNAAISTLENGMIIGSLRAALQAYPDLVDRHFGKYLDYQQDGLKALNTAFALDGLFIYVPEGVRVEKPVQIVNIINIKENIFVQPRNLIILEPGAELTLIHCDHSLKHKDSLINSVSEFYLGAGASLDHYKIQNKDSSSTLITTTHFHQEKESKLSSNILVLNGGVIRNNASVRLAGPYADADLSGIYLMDKEQHVDTHVYVDHAVPHCTSNELFKGILDDQASGAFYGHILVRKDAQQTLAYQNNRNLLLTDKARIHTKPHLEIYADDVKCSHGATVGQLDPMAMFYLRSRGIDPHNARMLLMYAFAAEVINKIKVPALRERIDELVSKRLRGELSICDQCILDCSQRRPVVFDIDLSTL